MDMDSDSALRSSPAETCIDKPQKNTSVQSYPEDFNSYRRMRLAEESRQRPRWESLFCELRVEESDSDEELVARLSCRGAAWTEDADSTEPEPYPLSLRSALRSLPPRTRTILQLSLQGKTKRALAQRYGICPQRVGQLIEQALHHLKKHHLKRNTAHKINVFGAKPSSASRI